MPDPAKKIFLSAVSNELASARDEVARSLRARGLEVKVQRDFRLEPDAPTTLLKIHNYIRDDCNAVVCIIGNRSGSVPPSAATEPFKHLLPAGLAAPSYTQWELLFALHYQRRLSIYIADTKYPAPDLATGRDDYPDLQKAFVTYLTNTLGLDRRYFNSDHELCRYLLEEEWPDLRHGKPSNLPSSGLGSLFKGRPEAEPLMRRALAIDEASFGKDHPNVAIDLSNLAALLRATNRLSEAEPLMRRALAIDEASFGKDHPRVAIDLNNLAQLLQDTNRLSEAEPLMRRVVEIFVNFLKQTGHEHPHLRAAIANYSALLQAAGRSEAEIEAELARILAGGPPGGG